MTQKKRERDGELAVKPDKKTDKAKLYKVLLHNDDYTPMDFVVMVLESIFKKSPAEAYRVMMQVHQSGIGIAGVYSHEVAETKLALTEQAAEGSGHPLRGSLEPE